MQCIQLWNEICVPKGLPMARMLSPFDLENACYLNKYLKNQEDWKFYFNKIANSKFLSGKNSINFRVYLNWALKPENASKVLNGAYDNVDNIENLDLIKELEKIKNEH